MKTIIMMLDGVGKFWLNFCERLLQGHKKSLGITLRKIDGAWYACQDIGCPDFKAAAASRKRQKEGYALAFWEWYENKVISWPKNMPLPPEIPQGSLPQVGKKESRRFEPCLIEVEQTTPLEEDVENTTALTAPPCAVV